MHYKLLELPEINEIKCIFFVGIKGVGMTPLAIIAKQAGIHVAGSDIDESFITDESLNNEEIIVFDNFEVNSVKLFFENYDKDECLVVTTGAHKGFDNPQVVWAKENGIIVLTQGQALGIFMEGSFFNREFEGISIAGSHGKTTISSLLASSLSFLKLDPTYSVGTGQLFPLGSPGHFGRGNFFVAEADEYASEPVYDKVPKFLYQIPKYAIFNNIDFDHPDLFKDLDDVSRAFVEFGMNIKSNGLLFINGDDGKLLNLKDQIQKDIRIITYGKKDNNDYKYKKLVIEGFESKFTVYKKNDEFGVFELNIPGEHNALNSLPVIAFLDQLGFGQFEIREALKYFKGSKRRLEIIGKTEGGALIIDDYGHHPLEIKTTLRAIKNSFPTKKIICIFQSHTYSRTKALLGDFSDSFSTVKELILLPIFKSQRDTEKDEISKEEYLEEFNKKTEAKFIEKFDDVVKYITQNYDSDEFLIVTIGAGDLNKIAYQLKK